ncbi:MAG TPA: hypothetical protein PLZ79_03565 [Burkholderiales bacterium]|nr:hypothetical protein [Burkholderiales bacterium]
MIEGSLPILDLVDVDGACMGWVLGHPIHEGKMLGSAVRLGLSANAPDSIERLERYLDGLAGRFLAIVLAPGVACVYPDSIGSLAVVYAPGRGMLSSSPFLIPYGEDAEDRVDLLSALRVGATRGRLLFGLAPRHGMHRLLPNHVLDLSTWTATRIWPRTELSGVDPADAVTGVAESVGSSISALVQRGPLTMSLTGGHDSRMLLACARPFVDRIRFATLPIPDRTGRIDVNLARAISRRHGLDHVVPVWAEASAEDLALWLYRTGFTAGAPRGQHAVRCQASLGNRHAYTEGLCGEYPRKVRLDRQKWSGGRPTPEELVAQFPGPVREESLRQAAAWLEGVSHLDPIMIMELAWMENSLGAWGGPMTYACPEGYEFMLYPLAHRRNFELWFGLPPEYRASGRFVTDFLDRLWPELLDVPFNQPVGWLQQTERARRFAARIRAALTGVASGAITACCPAAEQSSYLAEALGPIV